MIDDYPLYGCTSQTLTMAHVLLQLFAKISLIKAQPKLYPSSWCILTPRVPKKN